LVGGLQLEQITHIVEDWSPLYDNYANWMQKIKAALDPNASATDGVRSQRVSGDRDDSWKAGD